MSARWKGMLKCCIYIVHCTDIMCTNRYIITIKLIRSIKFLTFNYKDEKIKCIIQVSLLSFYIKFQIKV